MSKTAVEDVFRISMTFLRKHKYLARGHRGGCVTWTRTNAWGKDEDSVGIHVVISDSEKYIRFMYTITNRSSGEKRKLDYRVPIVATNCNYGGERYWFVCQLSNNGKHCGRRVGTVYKGGDWFGCRHCWNLTYEGRNKNRRHKLQPLFWAFDEEEKVQKLIAGAKRYTYKGRPTKKQRRIQGMLRRLEYHYEQFGDLENYL